MTTISKDRSGFINTEIHPLEPGVCQDEDFLVEEMLYTNSNKMPVCINTSSDVILNENIVAVGDSDTIHVQIAITEVTETVK